MKKISARIKQKEHRQIQIDSDFIRLDALLKLVNAVMTGGHAKIVIQEGDVKVNGEVCTARGKKIHQGENVEFDSIVYEVI
jgi:ribosome-associated protein